MHTLCTVAILAQGTTSGQCVSQGLFACVRLLSWRPARLAVVQHSYGRWEDPKSLPEASYGRWENPKSGLRFVTDVPIPTCEVNFRDRREEGEELELEFEFQFQA